MKKRTREIKIRLTDEELADLNAKVGQTVFSREDFAAGPSPARRSSRRRLPTFRF